MFQKNETHRQHSLFDSEQHLAPSLREDLRTSWAEMFYHEVFCRIDEELFSCLYSENVSRPNAPVNVLMAMDILKSGFGWSDRQLHEEVKFNVLVRHALGLKDLSKAPPRLRTLYNFRRRVRSYADKTGENLYARVFEQVTDEQLQAVGIETTWQRMDSTQVLSNLAQMSRLELIIATIRKIYMLMPAPMQARWAERLDEYIEKRPHEVVYSIPAGKAEEHLQELGQLLVELNEDLTEAGSGSEAVALAERVLREQYEINAEGLEEKGVEEKGVEEKVRLRAPDEISAQSVQSPHDTEATYRRKGGQSYRGGYVANVSETCTEENDVQLICDVQVETNATDDAALLKASLEGQAGREIEIEQLTTDGGYTGPRGEQACAGYEIELRPTRLRGGRSAPGVLGWEQYQWEISNGKPTRVTCPKGQCAEVRPGAAEGRFIARFDRQVCQGCPLLGEACRVVKRKRVGPTLYVQRRSVEVALRRQRLCKEGRREEDRRVRAVVESTVRSIKHPFGGDKLPVRGLLRSAMLLYGSALMVNLRRLHRYWRGLAVDGTREGVLEALYGCVLLFFATARVLDQDWQRKGSWHCQAKRTPAMIIK